MIVKTMSAKDLSSLLDISSHSIYKIVKDKSLDVIPLGNRKVLPPKTVRRILESRGFNMKPNNQPRVINVFGMKGGIGKTSIATALAEGASRLGFKTLAIDLDMQGNLTQSFNAKKHGQPVLLDAIEEKYSMDSIIQEVSPYLHLLPSSLENSQLETALSAGALNFVGYFKELLSDVDKHYDFIVIDCPPSVNKITVCAACYADINLIPLNADIDSYDGVCMSVGELKKIESSFKNFNLKINYKILFNKYDAREKLSLSIMGQVANNPELKDNMLTVVIRTNTAFKNTKADGEYIFDLKKSIAKEDCLSLISELTGINEWLETKKSKAVEKGEQEAVLA